VWSVDNPFLVIIAVVTAVGLLATVLTRLWVHQISLRLEEQLELDSRLVPLRNALTVLRDAVAQAHSIAKELETLRQLREEASTILVEVQTIRDQFAEGYNQALEDVTTHRATLAELIQRFDDTYQELSQTYLRPLLLSAVRRVEIDMEGRRLVEYLEANGFRVNSRLRALIAGYYDAESARWLGADANREGGVSNGNAEGPN